MEKPAQSFGAIGRNVLQFCCANRAASSAGGLAARTSLYQTRAANLAAVFRAFMASISIMMNWVQPRAQIGAQHRDAPPSEKT